MGSLRVNGSSSGYTEITGDTTGGAIVTSSSASNIPLTIKGANGQTANLLEIDNNAGTNVAYIDNSGNGMFSGTINASGTVKGSGSVVQFVSSAAGPFEVTTANASIGSVNLTPKYSSSNILVWINYGAYKYNATAVVTNGYRLRNVTNTTDITTGSYLVYSSPEYMFQGVVSGVQAASSTTSRQYSFLVDATGASDRLYFYWTRMYAMEIAT